MENLDDLNKLVAFTSVSHLIKNRIIPVNDNAKIRIQNLETFFEELRAGTRSITDGPYIHVENLIEILEYIGHSFSNTICEEWEEIDNAVKEFKDYTQILRELKENPKKLYSEEPRKVNKLLKICETMKNFYDRRIDLETSQDD
jgi:uncharacterized protein with von Willebrand factor type A (vWA) domain